MSATALPQRQLDVRHAVAVCVGMVIGAGIFKTSPMVAPALSSPAQLYAAWALGGLLSLVGSFFLFPKIADAVSGNTDITRMISSYTDSQSLLGNLDLSSQAVSGLTSGSISQIVEKAHLPEPIGTLLSHNLSQQVFSPLGSLATNVGDYVNQTVLSVMAIQNRD